MYLRVLVPPPACTFVHVYIHSHVHSLTHTSVRVYLRPCVPPAARIPYGRQSPRAAGVRRPAVLLVHGISLSSTCWVINEAENSLGFILADAGG